MFTENLNKNYSNKIIYGYRNIIIFTYHEMCMLQDPYTEYPL